MEKKIWGFSIRAKTKEDRHYSVFEIYVPRSFWARKRKKTYKSIIQSAAIVAGYSDVEVLVRRGVVDSGVKDVNGELLIFEYNAKNPTIFANAVGNYVKKWREYTQEYIKKASTAKPLLSVGTQLELDAQNPINQGKSGLFSYYVIRDILNSTSRKCLLYQVDGAAYTVKDTNDGEPIWGYSFITDHKLYTEEELLSWLKVKIKD